MAERVHFLFRCLLAAGVLCWMSIPEVSDAQQTPSDSNPLASTERNPFRPRYSALFADPTWRPVGAGTGFFVRADGRLLTNYHVVDDCFGLSVETPDGAEVVATMIGADASEDLALLSAPVGESPPVVFRKLVAFDGRRVAVIGYPDHGLQRIKPFMVTGSLTGPATQKGHRFAFEADVRKGNSGGPIFDELGLVVGVVFAKIDTASVFQSTGRHVEKLGFAIDNDIIRAFLRKQNVEMMMAMEGTVLDESALFDLGRRSVARVVCWRPANAPTRRLP
jgi:S1-C subfamily serine protease